MDTGAPRFSRALLALVGAVTLAAAPAAGSLVGPAGSEDRAHTAPIYLLAEAAHDIGHNDWAFQGSIGGRVVWAAGYVAFGLFWLGVALWMRAREKAWARRHPQHVADRLWLRTLVAAWAVLGAAGALTLGGGLCVDLTSNQLGPVTLRLMDVCSPWWGCVAALIVVTVAERSRMALYAAAGYGALLAVLLLAPLPGPDFIKVLVLAVAAAGGALTGAPQQGQAAAGGGFRSRLNRFAVARWMRASA